MSVVEGGFGRRRPTPQEQGRAFEERWAKRHGLDVQPRSGAGHVYKLDVGGHDLLAELKYTTHESFRVTAELFHGMDAGARGPGGRDTTPVLVVELEGVGQPVWVMREDDIIAMLNGQVEVEVKPSRRQSKRAAAAPALLREEDDDQPPASA